MRELKTKSSSKNSKKTKKSAKKKNHAKARKNLTKKWIKNILIGINLGLITLILTILSANYFSIPILSPILNQYKQLKNTRVAQAIYPTINLYISNDIKNILDHDKLSKVLQLKFKDIKRFNLVESEEQADITIKFSTKQTQYSISKIDLIPVGHFYWLIDSIQTKNIKTIYTLNNNKELIQNLLPKAKIKTFKNKDELLNALLAHQDKTSVGFLTLKQLDPRFKILTTDKNYYFLDSPDKNPFSIFINFNEKPKQIQAGPSKKMQITTHLFNYYNLVNTQSISSQNILTLNMTGVTALTRSLAIKIESTKQYDWPAQKIASFLKKADLTHTSNEVSFVPGCNPITGMRFCSSTKYVESLKKIGLDIIELTGNHNNDYGAQWNTYSIEKIYNPNKWDYFGGGLNATDAAKILYKDLKGTKLAFIGYNYYDTILNTGAIATDTHAGANSFSLTKLKSDIEKAKKQNAIVIVDFQFTECYAYPANYGIYPQCYKPIPNQAETFRKAIDYGADIVIGTQAHQPQTYEIYKGKLIFYGLGNLFFDQWQWPGTRQGLILTHYFYNGKHIQTKITTTEYNRDLQPYITTGKTRESLLNYLKMARPK